MFLQGDATELNELMQREVVSEDPSFASNVKIVTWYVEASRSS
jgi:hypothetical protein